MNENEKQRADLQKKFEADPDYMKAERIRKTIIQDIERIDKNKQELFLLLKSTMEIIDAIKTKISNQ